MIVGKFAFILVAAIASAASAAAGAAQSPLDKGHRILIERGLQIQALVFSDSPFDLRQMREAGFTAVNFGWSPKMSLLGPPPGFAWTKWTKGADDVDLPPDEKPYAANLISLALADEQNLNEASVRAAAAQWFGACRAKFPNAILYTNQYGGQVTNENMGAYMSACKPDMLCFDTYPFLKDGPAYGSPTNWYGDAQRYRKLSLGLGVPYGLWTQTFHGEDKYRDPSESEMRLNQFAAWTFGYKLVCAFTYNAGSSNLFKGPGDHNPKDAFRQLAKINRESSNLGPALVRLKSSDVRIILGQRIDPTTKQPADNARPIDVEVWRFGENDPYFRGHTIENIGTKNDKLRGDVLIGWFKPLEPGDPPEEIYFIVTNGLTDRNAAGPSCRQRITLNFHFKKSGIKGVQRLSRSSGKVEDVPLKAMEKDPGRYVMTLELDGGTGDLLKFNTGAPFVGVSPAAR